MTQRVLAFLLCCASLALSQQGPARSLFDSFRLVDAARRSPGSPPGRDDVFREVLAEPARVIDLGAGRARLEFQIERETRAVDADLDRFDPASLDGEAFVPSTAVRVPRSSALERWASNLAATGTGLTLAPPVDRITLLPGDPQRVRRERWLEFTGDRDAIEEARTILNLWSAAQIGVIDLTVAIVPSKSPRTVASPQVRLLGPAAIPPRPEGEVLGTGVLSLRAGGRGCLARLEETAYVADYLLRAVNGGVLPVPEVALVREGWSFEVEAHVLPDGTSLRLDVRTISARAARPFEQIPVEVGLDLALVTLPATTIRSDRLSDVSLGAADRGFVSGPHEFVVTRDGLVEVVSVDIEVAVRWHGDERAAAPPPVGIVLGCDPAEGLAYVSWPPNVPCPRVDADVVFVRDGRTLAATGRLRRRVGDLLIVAVDSADLRVGDGVR